MRLNYLANAIGLILKYIGLVMLVPIFVAVIYKDYNSIYPFLTAGVSSILIGYSLRKFVKNAYRIESLNDIKKAEALFVVAFSWIIFGLIASVPFLFYGLNPVNALFEAYSGITTCGATILTHFDYPETFFFWRSFSQWLGGLGIIVLFIAILPQFAVAGRQMFYAETPGPTEDKITPRIKNTAVALWSIYGILTVVDAVCLHLAGMPWFDSICTALSTLSAGGFSPNQEGIAGYHSNLISWITIFFMFFAGVSFMLQYKVITQRKPFMLFKSEEFRAYFTIVLVMAGVIAIALVLKDGYVVKHAITDSLFQVLSITTSTGSANIDWTKWDFLPQALLFMVMFMGSCASSAGAGIKMTRWLLIYKTMKNALVKILHPNAILNVKIDNATIPQDVLNQTVVFVFFYFICFAIGAALITMFEQNTTVGITGSIAALGNIGPAFGEVIGPMGSYDSLAPASKMIMVVCMLVGRLELFPFLVMLQKDFWTIKEAA